MSLNKRFLRDQRGNSASEYALILGMLGFSVVLGNVALTSAVRGEMDNSRNAIAASGAYASVPGSGGSGTGNGNGNGNGNSDPTPTPTSTPTPTPSPTPTATPTPTPTPTDTTSPGNCQSKKKC